MRPAFNNLRDAMSAVQLLPDAADDPPPHRGQRRERIDGGNPDRTPVDRVAARVVMPAAWWAKLLPKKAEPPPQAPSPKTERKKTNMGTERPKNRLATHPMREGKITTTPDDVFNAELVDRMSLTFEQSVEDAEGIVARAREATEAIEYIASHFEVGWTDCEALLKKSLAELRDTKFAVESETRKLLGSLGDVRKFFLDDKHESEVKRLTEFVALCERLQALQKSGFLDDVIGAILRLEERPSASAGPTA